jgi:hypothetical protein
VAAEQHFGGQKRAVGRAQNEDIVSHDAAAPYS